MMHPHPHRIDVTLSPLDLLHAEVPVAIDVPGGKESTAYAFAEQRITNRKKDSHGQ